MYSCARHWIQACFFLFLSLIFFRLQMAWDLGLNQYGMMSASGFFIGAGYDLVLVLVIAGLSCILGALPGVLFVPAGILASAAWLSNLANLIFFRFFGSTLDWWIVRLHWRDIYAVRQSGWALSLCWGVLFSFVFLALSIYSFKGGFLKGHPLKLRWRAVSAGVFIFFLGLLLKKTIQRTHAAYSGGGAAGSALATQVVFRWWKNFKPFGAMDSDLAALSEDSAAAIVKKYCEIDDERLLPSHRPAPVRAADAREARRLREALGLPADKAPSVIFLFIESLRFYEMQNPKTGPVIFPRLLSHLKKHAVLFDQTYVSILTTGETVRGQFSALCSLLPDPAGPATYISHPTINVRCLQQSFKEAGYRTVWINGFTPAFHNKGLFESCHGTQEFYDEAYFRKRGVRQSVGSMGLADYPVLDETVKLLEDIGSQGPFFANLLTLSTHHPWSVIPEGHVPADLGKAAADSPDYLGYLSRMRYADEALGNFLDKFMASPIAEETLIVLMGDHGVYIPPHEPLDSFRRMEIRYRIPMAFISKNLPAPARFHHPVHQMDAAPTVARIAGFKEEKGWMGKPLLKAGIRNGKSVLKASIGSPFVYYDGSYLAYRIGQTLCHTGAAGEGGNKCWKLRPEEDFFSISDEGRIISPPENVSAFVRDLSAAVSRLILSASRAHPALR